MAKLGLTGERTLPDEVKTEYLYLIFLRHLCAYRKAAEIFGAGQSVLDLGCGEGYGSAMMAQTVKTVVGLDVDPTAVAHAEAKYRRDNLRFQWYDGAKAPFADESFDGLISFQVIEHVPDDAAYTHEIHRVLKPGGIALISTPNRTYRLRPGQKPWNRFHLREYYPDELKAVLSKKFSDVQVLGVMAIPEVMEDEMRRCTQNRKIAELDFLNLRRLLPESLIPALIRVVRRAVYRDQKDRADDRYLDKYSPDDFFVSGPDAGPDVSRSLDLFAVCRK